MNSNPHFFIKLNYSFVILIFFIFIAVSVNIFHNIYFNVNVVFYSALFDITVALILTIILSKFFKLFLQFNFFELILICSICMCCGYIYAITIPTVIDRSLSIYFLEKIKQKGGGIKSDLVGQLISNEYIREYQVVAARVTEQIESGTISISNGCITLTPMGESIVVFTSYVRKNLLPKSRLLYNVYNDSLTDPFSRDSSDDEFSCAHGK